MAKGIARTISLTLLIALAVYLRCDLLHTKVFWQDEQWTRELVQKSPFHRPFWDYLNANVSTAPLDYLLLHGFTRLVPASLEHAWMLRWPACLYSLVSLWLFFQILKQSFPNDTLALWSGMSLFSFSLPLTFYAQEARPYSFWLLLVLLQLFFWQRFVFSESKLSQASNLGLLSLVHIALMQTATGSLFLVGMTMFVWMILRQRNQERGSITRFKVLFLTLGLPLLLSGPWLLHSMRVHYEGAYGWSEGLFNLRIFYGTVGGGLKASNLLFWILLGVGALSAWRQKCYWVVGLLLGTFVAAGAVMGSAWRANLLLSQRYLLFVIPISCLTAAYAVHGAPAKWRGLWASLIAGYGLFNISLLLRGMRL